MEKIGGLAGLALAFVCMGMEAKHKVRQGVRIRKRKKKK